MGSSVGQQRALTLVNDGGGYTPSLPDRFTTLAVAGGLVHIAAQLDPQNWRTSYATTTQQWSDELTTIGLDTQHRFAGQAYAFVGMVERWRSE